MVLIWILFWLGLLSQTPTAFAQEFSEVVCVAVEDSDTGELSLRCRSVDDSNCESISTNAGHVDDDADQEDASFDHKSFRERLAKLRNQNPLANQDRPAQSSLGAPFLYCSNENLIYSLWASFGPEGTHSGSGNDHQVYGGGFRIDSFDDLGRSTFFVSSYESGSSSSGGSDWRRRTYWELASGHRPEKTVSLGAIMRVVDFEEDTYIGIKRDLEMFEIGPKLSVRNPEGTFQGELTTTIVPLDVQFSDDPERDEFTAPNRNSTWNASIRLQWLLHPRFLVYADGEFEHDMYGRRRESEDLANPRYNWNWRVGANAIMHKEARLLLDAYYQERASEDTGRGLPHEDKVLMFGIRTELFAKDRP